MKIKKNINCRYIWFFKVIHLKNFFISYKAVLSKICIIKTFFFFFFLGTFHLWLKWWKFSKKNNFTAFLKRFDSNFIRIMAHNFTISNLIMISTTYTILNISFDNIKRRKEINFIFSCQLSEKFRRKVQEKKIYL